MTTCLRARAAQPDRVIEALAIASAVSALTACVWFLFVVYPAYLHSDAASKVLLAEEALRSGHWIPRGWHYVSDSVSLADGAQVAMPFVSLLGTTPVALAAAASVAAALFVLSVYALGHSIGLSPVMALAAAATVAGGSSMIYSDLLLGLMITVPLAWMALLILAAIRALQRERASAWLCVCGLLILLAFATNPRKALVFEAIPLIVAATICSRGLAEAGRRERLRHFILTVLASSVLGFQVHRMLDEGLHVNSVYAQYVSADGIRQVGGNLLTIAELGLKFLGMKENGPATLASLMASLHRTVAATVLLAMFALGARDALRKRDVVTALPAVYAIVSALLVASALVTSQAIKRDYGVYYFVYSGVPAVLVAFRYLVTRAAWLRNAGILLVVIPSLLLSVRTHLWGNPYYRGPGVNQLTNNVQKARLIEWLEARNLRGGYSYFWEANTMTILSSGRVRVAPIRVGNTALRPFFWLASDEAFVSAAESSPVFVALPSREGVVRAVPDCVIAHSQVHDVPPYRVYILPSATGCLKKP